MTDACLQLLAQQAHQVDGPQLLIADENLTGTALQLLSKEKVSLITNRYDLYQQALLLGFTSLYSDFDFSAFVDKSIAQVLYRVSKEKPVTHHIINSTRRILASNGKLVLTGEKKDGIKTYANKAALFFGDDSTCKKHGSVYLATIDHRTSEQPPLDDQHYLKLRACIPTNSQSLYSKPGLFGWSKIDQGSAFLVEYLPTLFQSLGELPNSVLDLGCGYGYLSAMMHEYIEANAPHSPPNNINIVATDNNAAAIAACTKNFDLLGIDGQVIAGNCADTIDQAFDVVICNPPFHQGFGTNSQLTQRFVDSAYQHLNRGGKALFVTNSFVPIEDCAEKQFEIKRLAKNKGFKLILLSKH